MTGDATDPAIIDKMPPAIGDSIGLKTNIVNPAPVWQKHHRIEALVAGAAEFLHLIEGVQTSRIKNLWILKFLCLDCRNMFLARTMTGFAGDARLQTNQL